MKKLKLKENEVVHCATLKQAKKVLKIAHELGLTWNEDNLNMWNMYKEDTCYNFNSGTCISYAEKDFYMYDEDFLCKVITSKEFIKRHKKKNKYKALEDRIKLIESIYNQELLTVNTQLSRCIEYVEVLQAIINGTNESSTIIKSNVLQYPKGWYKSTVKGNKAFIYFNGYDFLYGINYNGVWENESFVQEDRKLKAIYDRVIVKATYAEVEQRLIEEATKRGFNINCEINCKNGQNFPAILNSFEYVEEENKLLYSGIEIMKDGVWENCKPYEKETEQPQIGDVVKAWDDDKSNFVYGVLVSIDEDSVHPYVLYNAWFKNIEKVTEMSINDFKK